MRQKGFAALMITALLLTACGSGGDANRAAAFCAALQSTQVQAAAEVTALYDDAVETFTLALTETDGVSELEVLAPELIAGVRAHVNAGETTLEFDGVVLPAPLEPGGISPLMALPMVLRAARTGHLDLVWQEGEYLVLQLIPEDDLAVRLYLDAADTPAYAEIIREDAAAVRCTITQWNETGSDIDDEQNDPNLGGDQSQHPGT